MSPKPLAMLKQLKGLDLKEITKRAEMHDEITLKILEIVNEMQKNQQKIMDILNFDKTNEEFHEKYVRVPKETE